MMRHCKHVSAGSCSNSLFIWQTHAGSLQTPAGTPAYILTRAVAPACRPSPAAGEKNKKIPTFMKNAATFRKMLKKIV
jgi:hypothetical protein